jgi:carboxypeptidase Q
MRKVHFLLPLLLAGATSLTCMIPPLTFAQSSGSARPAATLQRTDSDKQAYRREMESADQKIAEEVKAHSELMKNLEYLTTQIGPRLTGSPQMQAASDWTLKRFRDYGIDAHLETAQIPHSWTRGSDTAEITAPISRRIEVRSFGWGKATDKPVSGPVVVVEVKSLDDLAQYKDKLKGAVILPGKPRDPIDEEKADNAYDAVIPPPKGLPKEGEMSFRDRFRMLKLVAEAGGAVVLLDSSKNDNLFNMAGGYNRYQPSDMPLAFISHEDYSLIYRLRQAGPVTLKVDLEGKFSSGPVPASITVAEIKGSQLPDERVIVGGHLDSWDLGQGAVDNGTGAMAVLEAARTLKALNFKPKRTVTFVLFTGEEQGGVGAETFIKNHEAEIPKMDAVLIHDTGTGKVFSIALENLWSTAPLMHEIYLPLQEIFELRPLSTRFFGASDHEIFLRKGVPAYFCIQNPDHYGDAHHSQADTFDKVIPEEINEGAALLAAWAWNVSEMPAPLPHHAAADESGGME